MTQKRYNIEKIKDVLRELFFDRWGTQNNDLYNNNLDPFSAILSSAQGDMSSENWIKAEEVRQLGATEQNSIGLLHQKLIACFDGVVDLETGNILDIICEDKKIIAEIKNKFNTTKGNHKREIYDDIESRLLEKHYIDYTGYYVEVIPKKPVRYNKAFTPPDNRGKTKRPVNEKIRIIDGVSFYDIISGHENTLKMIFKDIIKSLPDLMEEYEMSNDNFKAEDFEKIFNKVFFGI